jgi:putative PIN family toxin of toxin-antitoxin system
VRIVLDTTILVRANDSSTGLARQLLISLLKTGHTLVVSGEILHEVAKVLRCPRFRMFHKLTEDGIYQYIGFLREVAEIVTLDLTLTVPIRDVNDIIVAQTAILGEAAVLCTMDQDFFDPAAGVSWAIRHNSGQRHTFDSPNRERDFVTILRTKAIPSRLFS